RPPTTPRVSITFRSSSRTVRTSPRASMPTAPSPTPAPTTTFTVTTSASRGETMSVSSYRFAQRRPGFTLIELLVVIGLILALATLTVAVVGNSMDQDRVRQGADQMQGWLVMAKQWAK